MEPLENKNIKVLLIVEGESLEPKFFERLTEVYGLKLDVYVVGTNIYALYQKMKTYEFACDVKDVLPEIGVRLEGKDDLLKEKFTYTYLIFDFDAHHKTTIEREQGIAVDTIVQNNVVKLAEMAEYFVDETDPSVGRLYINYPMMESFRDANEFFDDAYERNEISIDDLKKYKSIAGQKRLAGIDVDTYSRENFTDLTRMNVFKLNAMMKAVWGAPAYQQYLNISPAKNILDAQIEKIGDQRKVDVLNTALFILLDYYGNRDGFYDSIVATGTDGGEEAQREKVLQEV